MKKKDFISADFFIVVLITVMTILYVSLIFNRNIWTDEAFTMDLVNSNSIIGIIKETAVDVHPPLYYLIAYIFVAIFGTSFQVYKIVSIVPMILTMLLAIVYIKPWFGEKTAILFILFLNAMPCVMEYGVQMRMYSWCIYFISLAALSAYGYCRFKSKKYLLFLTLAALCACYTHNFAMISAVFIYIFLGVFLILRERKIPFKWLLSGSVVSVFYIPWLLVLYNQTNNRVGNYWISNIDKETVIGYFADIFDSRIPYSTIMFVVLLFLSFVLLIIRMCYDKSNGLFGIMLFLVPIFTAFLGVTVSILITPFFIARYLLPCMGLMALGFALAFGNEKKYTYIFLCLFLVCMIGNSYYENYKEEYLSTNVAGFLEYMDEQMDDDDIIIYNYEMFDFIYECYFDAEHLVFLEDFDFGTEYENVWFIDSCCTPWLPDATLTQYGLTKEYVNTFSIEHNEFRLYRIYK
ncbi:MAG: glycosyltransferase family 39 protein [Lachnospiraceae bacterium]|nr:glycosyltransferase family 39 protein [Lachnospiraceae bacterium]